MCLKTMNDINFATLIFAFPVKTTRWGLFVFKEEYSLTISREKPIYPEKNKSDLAGLNWSFESKPSFSMQRKEERSCVSSDYGLNLRHHFDCRETW